MGKSKNHLTGKKVTNNHTSIIGPAMAPIQAATKLDCVSKVSLGIIKAISNGPVSIKFSDEGLNCLLVKIRGPRSIQEIRIYTSEKELTMATCREYI